MIRILTDAYGPGSIFYPYYLASALAITLVWLLTQRVGPRRAFGQIFARDHWIQKSVLTDLKFTVFYLLLLRTLITAVEAAAFIAALGWVGRIVPLPASSSWVFNSSALVEGGLATLVTMVSIDFASYAVHRALHGCAPLWKIHRVHHSAESLTPLTTYRQHPLEPLILYGARGFASGLGLALFYRFFPSQTPVITISGLGAGFFIYMFTVNLHHAPIPVRYPSWLQRVLISPHAHHLHHSRDPRHHGSNFGVVFSFWDRIFGTYRDERFEPGALRFGLYQTPPPPEL